MVLLITSSDGTLSLTSMPWALLIFSGFKILCRRPTSQHVLKTHAWGQDRNDNNRLTVRSAHKRTHDQHGTKQGNRRTSLSEIQKVQPANRNAKIDGP